MTVKKYDVRRIERRNQIQNKVDIHRKFDDDSSKYPKSNRKSGDDRERNLKYFELYRFSTTGEKFLIILGLIMAILSSFGIPYSLIYSGEFHTLLIDRTTSVGTTTETSILILFGGGKILTNASKLENMAALKDDALAIGMASLFGAIVEWILLASSVDIFNRVAIKQINRIRKQFLASLLRQDMTWYDTSSDSNFSSKMTEELSKLKEGIAEKVAIFTNLSMSFVSSMMLSFFFGWIVSLIVLICCPIVIFSTILVDKIQSSLTEKELESCCVASSVAEEVIGGIRTVHAFSGERKETERYNRLVLTAAKVGHRKGLLCGICAGTMWIIIYSCFAVAFFYAAKVAMSVGTNGRPAAVVTLLFGIILEAHSVGLVVPYLEVFGAAKSAAGSIFSIIDRKTEIDPCNEDGLSPEQLQGHIEYKNVHFKYQARPKVKVLKGLSLSIKPGQTVALVGPSGCGKTTCLQLLQRFYDPIEGCVELDGVDVRKLNVHWLRSQIGVVGQEPVLFSTTIEENIRFGRPTITQEEIEAACKMAYCHEFITKLPDGYKTMLGEMGSKISGGQKQRIAIARALAKNPKILLLDEATSALDQTNERLVHKALETARKDRTTIMIAHRLSTVKDADVIVFIQDGNIMEQGNHESLMALKGYYYDLMSASERSSKSQRPQQEKKSSLVEKPDVVSEKDEILEEEDKIESKKKFRKFLKLNYPEWKYLLLGGGAALIEGAMRVIFMIFFGQFIGSMSEINSEFEAKANMIVVISAGIGVFAGLASFTQIYMLNVAGTNLTSRLRQKAFKSIISQDIGYFDDQKNSVGALCSRLSGDCSNVQGATGLRLGIVLQAFSTVTVAIVLSMMLSWNLTMVTLVMLPFGLGSVIFESYYTEKSSEDERLATEKAAQLAVESVANIRTIYSLGQEMYVLERYLKQIDLADDAARKKSCFRGIVFGFGDASQYIVFGISLFYGGLLVANGQIEYQDIIIISEALQLGTWMLAQACAYAPNFNDAASSMRRLLTLFDTSPSELSSPNERKFENCDNFNISYNNVGFSYPTRRNHAILRDFNLKISSGSTIALVGPSGCGKSTCVQLLLRFYDPTSGVLNLNGIPTEGYDTETLRSQMSLVSQEPILFDRSIAENIAYGDNSRENIPLNEIMESAKKSNIHDFIVSLPQGYNTRISRKGSQLSCGQKQRIAIARAFIRNPKILLLDEATSALDMQSEKLVQEALENASNGRTCIMIAQRLSTIRNADMICVMKDGRIIEHGTHDELMDVNGAYAELLSMRY